MIRQLLQVKLWWLSDFLFFEKQVRLAFLRDSLFIRIIMSYQIDYGYIVVDERSLLEWIHK